MTQGDAASGSQSAENAGQGDTMDDAMVSAEANAAPLDEELMSERPYENITTEEIASELEAELEADGLEAVLLNESTLGEALDDAVWMSAAASAEPQETNYTDDDAERLAKTSMQDILDDVEAEQELSESFSLSEYSETKDHDFAVADDTDHQSAKQINDGSDDTPKALDDHVTPETVDTDVSDDTASEITQTATDEALPPAGEQKEELDQLGLKAISLMGDRVKSNEERYNSALSEMNRLMGIVANRMEKLENRVEERVSVMGQVTNSAVSNENEYDELPADDSVAPYIANAEREIRQNRSGGGDVFDRIAAAAGAQYDASRSTDRIKIADTSNGNGHRVGTEKWTSSRTVARRMQRLQAAKEHEQAHESFEADTDMPLSGYKGDQGQELAHSQGQNAAYEAPEQFEQEIEAAHEKAQEEAIAKAAEESARSEEAKAQAAAAQPTENVIAAEQELAQQEPAQAAQSQNEDQASVSENTDFSFGDANDADETGIAEEAAAPTPDTDETHNDEEDDGDLIVIPGARGRRRNRARKSKVDQEMEALFSEGDADPNSISGLRRKLRDTDAQAATLDNNPAEKKGSLLGKMSSLVGSGKRATDDGSWNEDTGSEVDAQNAAQNAEPATELQSDFESDDLTMSDEGMKDIAFSETDSDLDDEALYDGEMSVSARKSKKPLLFGLLGLGAAGGGYLAYLNNFFGLL